MSERPIHDRIVQEACDAMRAGREPALEHELDQYDFGRFMLEMGLTHSSEPGCDWLHLATPAGMVRVVCMPREESEWCFVWKEATPKTAREYAAAWEAQLDREIVTRALAAVDDASQASDGLDLLKPCCPRCQSDLVTPRSAVHFERVELLTSVSEVAHVLHWCRACQHSWEAE